MSRRRSLERALLAAMIAVVACASAGCGRRVVVHPSRVAAENDREWKVKSEPRPAQRPVAEEPKAP